ncbi:MAG: 3-carboxy-cis,cis-muconate cycloisomerase [Marinovum sp.]|nr:3-carboxy-cis,cis-muconate cycloisomerase [Marinovum sp.]
MVNCLVGNGIWGRLFSDDAVVSLFSAEAQLGHMLAFETAWTEGLYVLGEISEDARDLALHALETYEPDLHALAVGSEMDGVPVPAFVRALRANLPADAWVGIHHGSTSQDVIDTTLVLILREAHSLFADRLGEVENKLSDLWSQFGDCDLMGRTRMQAALPIGVAARIDAWGRGLAEAADVLDSAWNACATVQVGGPVGQRDFPTGQGDGLAEFVAKVLDLGVSDVWHTQRARLTGYGHAMTLVTSALRKIGIDIALMSQNERNEIVIKLSGTSSAMPHKSNPINAEALITLHHYVAAQQAMLLHSAGHEQERSGANWALEWLALPAMVEGTAVSLEKATHLLSQISAIGSNK